MALKTGRSGQPVQKVGGRLAMGWGSAAGTRSWCPNSARYRSSSSETPTDVGSAAARKRLSPVTTT